MFATLLHDKILEKNSRLCVGLDPRIEWIPTSLTDTARQEFGDTFDAAGAAIFLFNKQVIDRVAPLVPAVKPQIAFYEQYGIPGLIAFQKTVAYAKEQGLVVIIDAKRGDIDSTAAAYANTFGGSTQLFGSEQTAFPGIDCVTVNPFLGKDSLDPFVEMSHNYGSGLFILVKTSNPGSKDLQDSSLGERTVTQEVADWVAAYASEKLDDRGYSNIGAVVGATFPEEARMLRERMPHSIFLVPGLGSQGGGYEGLGNFFDQEGLGAVINSSRGITFSQRGEEGSDWLDIIEHNTREAVANINQAIGK